MPQRKRKHLETTLSDVMAWHRLRRDPPYDYESNPGFIEKLSHGTPWDTLNEVRLNPNSNFMRRLLAVAPGYYEEEPRVRYYLRAAFLAGENLGYADGLRDSPGDSEESPVALSDVSAL